MDYTGLEMHNGRLINNRPNEKTGIQKMAEVRKAAKVAQKVSIQADAIMLANMQTMGAKRGCMDCM